jgi:ComF family protein
MARSAGAYDGSLRAIIHAFKYGKCRALGPPLALLLRQSGADVLRDADAVVPVPLHWRRLLARGFNQADDLARGLRKPIWRLLRRRRSGPPQATLTGRRRADNVSQAFRERQPFAVELLPRALREVRLFDGPTVVLIDDVLTTGATANACARELIHAGARRVRVLTVARAAAARPAPPPLSRDPSAVHRR